MVAPPRTYLDHNATAPLRPEAKSAMLATLDACGNASSVHAEGRAARGRIEAAREAVAALAGWPARQVVFTSGGTEANAMALMAQSELLLLVGAMEHPCVLAGHGFAPDRVETIPARADGTIELDWLSTRLERLPGPVLVALQAANNETGVMQPVAEAAALVHRHGGRLHCDAVQAFGRLSPDTLAGWGADTLAVSAHKLGGPQGIGALLMVPGAEPAALLRGGGQERGRRAGTENGAGIAGFGAAATAARRDGAADALRLAALRGRLEAGLRQVCPEIVIFGETAVRLPNTSLFTVPGLAAETALIAFDLAGCALSSGAACSSGTVRRSHVLDAMGVAPALASGALRASLGWSSDTDDVIRFLAAFEQVVSALQHRRGRRAA
ncbi:MAG: cysteine desulfurase family protein [Alsobacter sp.]